MNKGRAGMAMVIFLCVSMAAVMFAGCGSGGAARIENPLEFFFQARENMQTVASFRMSGEMQMEYTDAMETDMVMSVDYDMVCEQKSGGEMLAKMDMDFDGPETFDVTAYIAGDRMYMEVPGGMWVYEEVDLASELADMGQVMGPQYVMDVLDMAESAEVVAEDGKTITFKLVFNPDKLMQGQKAEVERMIEDLEEEGISEDDIEEIMKVVEQVLSEMEYEMTVDKDSGLAVKIQFYLEMDFSSLASMFPDDPPPDDAGMIMEADFDIGDYGKTFDIQLPEEAEDAIPIEELESLAET